MVRRPWILLAGGTFWIRTVLGLLGVVIATANAGYVDPYWLDLSSNATVAVLFLAPGFAALGAWESARWKSLALVPVRSWPGLLVRHLAVAAVGTAVTFAVTLALLAARVGPTYGGPRWDVLAAGVWTVTAYAAVGFLAGRFLPRLVAAPMSFAAVWFWVAYTPAVQPFWLRNVTGNLGTSCCGLDQELARFALLAPALVGSALVVGAVVVLAGPDRLAAWLAAGVLLAGAVTVAAQLVAGFGADPTQPRTGDQVCVESAATGFCAWPENGALLARAVPGLSATVARFREAGLDVPRVLRESQRGRGGWSFTLGSPIAADWARTLATSPLDRLPPPCVEGNGGLWPAGDQVELVRAWLEVVGGVPVAGRTDISAQDRARLRRILRAGPREQEAWFTEAYDRLQTCEPIP